MTDLIASLIAHCKADSTLVALLPGATSIATEMEVVSETLPQLAIGEESRTRTGGVIVDARVNFSIRTTTRSAAISIRNSLVRLFDNKYQYSIASGGDALTIVMSSYLPNAAVAKEDASAAFQYDEVFTFNFASEV